MRKDTKRRGRLNLAVAVLGVICVVAFIAGVFAILFFINFEFRSLKQFPIWLPNNIEVYDKASLPSTPNYFTEVNFEVFSQKAKTEKVIVVYEVGSKGYSLNYWTVNKPYCHYHSSNWLPNVLKSDKWSGSFNKRKGAFVYKMKGRFYALFAGLVMVFIGMMFTWILISSFQEHRKNMGSKKVKG